MMNLEYKTITIIKKEVVVFVLGLRDLGLIQDLTFLNNLIKLHDLYIDKLMDSMEMTIN